MFMKHRFRKSKYLLGGFIFALTVLIFIAGCTSPEYENSYAPCVLYEPQETDTPRETLESTEAHEPQETAPAQTEPTIQHESRIPLDVAAAYFSKLQAIWDEDDGALWGIPLHTPIIFACPMTRHAVANMPDPEGLLQRQNDVYVGILPQGVIIASTAADFNGLRWGMMSWDMVEMTHSFGESALRTLAHEAFHAIQGQVVSGAKSGMDDYGYYFHMLPIFHRNHKNLLDVRISITLEQAALFAAVRTSGDERMTAIHDALSIRYDRRRRHPEMANRENAYEILEGLATFTDQMLVSDSRDEMIAFFQATASDINAFGYTTGALYSLLLEEAGADWKGEITWITDLGYLLKQYLGIAELTAFEQLNLEPYGYDEITAIHTAWVENFNAMMDGAREAMLTQPTLDLVGGFTIDFFAAVNAGGMLRIEDIFIPNDDPAGRPLGVRHGNFAIYGSNWRLGFVQYGYVSYITQPGYGVVGISIGGAIDIEINDDGSRAASPTWELVITDDNYMIQATPNGLVEIVRR